MNGVVNNADSLVVKCKLILNVCVFFVIQGCAARASVTLRRPGEAMGQMRISCSSIRTVDGR